MIRRHPLLAYIVITILPVLIVVGAVVFFAPTPRDGADNLVYRRPGYNFTNALVPYDPTIIRVSETPAYPPLTLPTPQPGRVFQQYLASSSDYLVWVESVMSQTWPFRNDEILALDLHTNKVTILTNTPGRRNRLYTSGSIVLWTGQRDYEQCPNGSETIVKDIVTSHTLATIDCSYHLYPESV